MNIKEFIINHFNFGFNFAVIPAIICLLLVVPCTFGLPPQYGYENGILENIQMVILLIAFIFSIKAKANKKFFIFIALLILLFALREVNYGRTLFFPIPGQENMFYSWKEIKYGYLVNPIVGLYMAGMLIYFIVNKLYLVLWQYISKIKLPVINFIFLFVGIILSIYADKHTHNFVFEEMSELLLYSALAGIICLYAFNKDFR
ncbi:hypothetical protein IJ182_00300 [bacterium]|nr:hypothetical protein [bacterium]